MSLDACKGAAAVMFIFNNVFRIDSCFKVVYVRLETRTNFDLCRFSFNLSVQLFDDLKNLCGNIRN